MYHAFQVEKDQLLAISDKKEYVRVMPITRKSKEEILMENKIEAYETAILNEEKAKKEYAHKEEQNHKIAIISVLFIVIVTILLAALALCFMPLTPLVSNVGFISWIVSFVAGMFITDKACSNEQYYYNKMLESDKLIEILQQEITNEKQHKDFLNMATFYDSVKQPDNSISNERVEAEYNKQLKQHFLEIRAELKRLQQLAKQQVLQEGIKVAMDDNDDFDIVTNSKQKKKLR